MQLLPVSHNKESIADPCFNLSTCSFCGEALLSMRNCNLFTKKLRWKPNIHLHKIIHYFEPPFFGITPPLSIPNQFQTMGAKLFLKYRPRAKERTEVRITQNKGKERKNSYQKLKRSP